METTTNICSVAIGTVESYLEDSRDIPRKHNEQLLGMIDSVVKHSGYEKQQIDCVAFSAGPGSFTGVRLGASVTQAIATGLNCQSYCVPSALVLAEVARPLGRVGRELITVRRSRREWVYVAKLCKDQDKDDFTLIEEQLERESDVPDTSNVVHDDLFNLSATLVLEIAAKRTEEWHDPQFALPIYVTGDTPWKKTN
ncbi:MAG: tRNA (adenosine(37)-N6)-threonylcarbamoyltransferase complex dimerization subunit type 1 TsaB [Gammaproteobacteria bacterium]|nr:tRNA (adenosine(37)-N6)-threonylcarbamoyltransferase complex dimerization subunit type 1 TsaB [Gammaproteobacteria bacterium]